MENFNILAKISSSGGWFEPYLVANPDDRFSYIENHIIHILYIFNSLGEWMRGRVGFNPLYTD